MIVSAVPLLVLRSLSVTFIYSVLSAAKFNCSVPLELVRDIVPVTFPKTVVARNDQVINR